MKMDWKNLNEAIGYTQDLLKKQYNLSIKLPIDRLCPPIPNRLNYIVWLQSIIQLCQLEENIFRMCYDEIKVLDIGTGASIIYPILGYKHYNWHFLGSETDLYSYKAATDNLESNKIKLDNHIQLVLANSSEKFQSIFHPLIDIEPEPKGNIYSQNSNSDTCEVTMEVDEFTQPLNPTTAIKNVTIKELMLSLFRSKLTSVAEFVEANSGPIIQALLQTSSILIKNIILNSANNFYHEHVVSTHPTIATEQSSEDDLLLHSTMCNPPFYDLNENISKNPKTVCSGSNSEMRTLGGEVSFVYAMIADSLILRSW
jgi:23S rRNA A1618 N6-methylase RlmF